MAEWTVERVADWVRLNAKLPEYAEDFLSGGVDGSLLESLSAPARGGYAALAFLSVFL
jgi:hypothetical protein